MPRRPTTPREVAMEVLRRVEDDDAYSHLALDAAQREYALDDPRDRALLTQLVYGCLTWSGPLEHLIDRFSKRPARKLDAPVRRAMQLALYQILFLDKIPPHAAVHESVELIKHSKHRRASGLVNGLLRNVLRKGPATPWQGIDPEQDPLEFIALRHAMPRWIAQVLLDQHSPARSIALAEAYHQSPPLYLRDLRWRPQPQQEQAQDLQDAQRQASTPGEPETPKAPEGQGEQEGLELLDSLPGAARAANAAIMHRALETGSWAVQDVGSQLVGHLARPDSPQATCMDACAGLGSKSLHLMSFLDEHGSLLAVEPQRSKLAHLRAQLEARADDIAPDVELVEAPLQQALAQDPARRFDLILLDAPCSGLGTMRRHPETRWRRSRDDVAQLAALQRDLLEAATAALAPGGLLVYAVCTFTSQEGPAQIEALLQRHPELVRDPAPQPWLAALTDLPGELQLNPLDHDSDGFYAARLRRKDA